MNRNVKCVQGSSLCAQKILLLLFIYFYWSKTPICLRHALQAKLYQNCFLVRCNTWHWPTPLSAGIISPSSSKGAAHHLIGFDEPLSSAVIISWIAIPATRGGQILPGALRKTSLLLNAYILWAPGKESESFKVKIWHCLCQSVRHSRDCISHLLHYNWERTLQSGVVWEAGQLAHEQGSSQNPVLVQSHPILFILSSLFNFAYAITLHRRFTAVVLLQSWCSFLQVSGSFSFVFFDSWVLMIKFSQCQPILGIVYGLCKIEWLCDKRMLRMMIVKIWWNIWPIEQFPSHILF